MTVEDSDTDTEPVSEPDLSVTPLTVTSDDSVTDRLAESFVDTGTVTNELSAMVTVALSDVETVPDTADASETDRLAVSEDVRVTRTTLDSLTAKERVSFADTVPDDDEVSDTAKEGVSEALRALWLFMDSDVDTEPVSLAVILTATLETSETATSAVSEDACVTATVAVSVIPSAVVSAPGTLALMFADALSVTAREPPSSATTILNSVDASEAAIDVLSEDDTTTITEAESDTARLLVSEPETKLMIATDELSLTDTEPVSVAAMVPKTDEVSDTATVTLSVLERETLIELVSLTPIEPPSVAAIATTVLELSDAAMLPPSDPLIGVSVGVSGASIMTQPMVEAMVLYEPFWAGCVPAVATSLTAAATPNSGLEPNVETCSTTSVYPAGKVVVPGPSAPKRDCVRITT
jgi:hypothetical protein